VNAAEMGEDWPSITLDGGYRISNNVGEWMQRKRSTDGLFSRAMSWGAFGRHLTLASQRFACLLGKSLSLSILESLQRCH
jgi:hypothetical protein